MRRRQARKRRESNPDAACVIELQEATVAKQKRRGMPPPSSDNPYRIGWSYIIPKSSTFGSCASGSAATPSSGRDHRRQRVVAAALAAHLAGDPFQHLGVDVDGLRRRPALDVGVGRQRHRARRHRQAELGRRMMGDRLGQEIVETAVVAALGGSVADFKQRLGFGAAHRLMLDRGRGQDARAPGGVIGIERAGKMDAAPGGRAFAGDHAIADDGERMGCGLAAGWLERTGRFRLRSGLGTRGRHRLHFSISFSDPAFPCGRKRVVNDSKLAFRDF